jgi:hypothetical protein
MKIDGTVKDFIDSAAPKFPGIVEHNMYNTPIGSRTHILKCEPGDMTRYRFLLLPLPGSTMIDPRRDKYLVGFSPAGSKGFVIHDIEINGNDLLITELNKSYLFRKVSHLFDLNEHTSSIIVALIQYCLNLDIAEQKYI